MWKFSVTNHTLLNNDKQIKKLKGTCTTFIYNNTQKLPPVAAGEEK